jgi:hypothetical protein
MVIYHHQTTPAIEPGRHGGFNAPSVASSAAKTCDSAYGWLVMLCVCVKVLLQPASSKAVGGERLKRRILYDEMDE